MNVEYLGPLVTW
jgi:hypothetical protein